MAILFMESWDHYGTAADLLLKWTGGAQSGTGIAFTTGKSGSGNALRLSRPTSQVNVQRHLHATTTYGTLIVGFWFRASAFNNGDPSIVYFGENAFNVLQGNLAYNSSGQLRICRGPGQTSVLATSTPAMSANTWHHIECKYVCHNTAGSAVVKLDGVEVINVSGVDTSDNGAAALDGVMMFGANSDPNPNSKDYDDLWVVDTSGSVNNDFLGRCSVVALHPDGAGGSTQWTPNTGTNHGAVDEVGQDGDTTYVASATAGNKDLYAFGNLGASDVPLAVEVFAVTKKDDATARTFATTMRSGATDADGPTYTQTTSYDYTELYRDTDPDTSAAWTKAGVDALQAGVKVVS